MLVEPAEKNPPKRLRLGTPSERRSALVSIARLTALHPRNSIFSAHDYDQRASYPLSRGALGLRHSISVHQA